MAWSAVVLGLLLLFTTGFCKPGTSSHPEQIAEAYLVFVNEELIALCHAASGLDLIQLSYNLGGKGRALGTDPYVISALPLLMLCLLENS